MHESVGVYISECMSLNMYVCGLTCIYVNIYTFHMCMHACMSMYIYIHVYRKTCKGIYVCMHVHTYAHYRHTYINIYI